MKNIVLQSKKGTQLQSTYSSLCFKDTQLQSVYNWGRRLRSLKTKTGGSSPDTPRTSRFCLSGCVTRLEPQIFVAYGWSQGVNKTVLFNHNLVSKRTVTSDTRDSFRHMSALSLPFTKPGVFGSEGAYLLLKMNMRAPNLLRESGMSLTMASSVESLDSGRWFSTCLNLSDSARRTAQGNAWWT